ncbi:MAG TPA: YaaA family protein [Candidatus Saccharimonadales bacterium]|nr:YaaA family protein [Candidatus Saccharimonadales bacterium]
MDMPLTILLHSSKTMRPSTQTQPLHRPLLGKQAKEIGIYLKTLSPEEIAKCMHVSSTLAGKTHKLIADWSDSPGRQSIAIDSFVGDIYSGLRASELSKSDRDYADKTLRILSGLYGVIRPYDGICSYRLEMAYRLPDPKFTNLYAYWSDAIARCLPTEGTIVNVSSVEYTKAVLPLMDSNRVITPRFLTADPKTGDPAFVVVHAKIARGAFARWLITSRTTNIAKFSEFSDIGYRYNKQLSTPSGPVFVCQTFGGIGLSMRLD